MARKHSINPHFRLLDEYQQMFILIKFFCPNMDMIYGKYLSRSSERFQRVYS